jgi:hypothetical protein
VKADTAVRPMAANRKEQVFMLAVFVCSSSSVFVGVRCLVGVCVCVLFMTRGTWGGAGRTSPPVSLC